MTLSHMCCLLQYRTWAKLDYEYDTYNKGNKTIYVKNLNYYCNKEFEENCFEENPWSSDTLSRSMVIWLAQFLYENLRRPTWTTHAYD